MCFFSLRIVGRWKVLWRTIDLARVFSASMSVRPSAASGGFAVRSFGGSTTAILICGRAQRLQGRLGATCGVRKRWRRQPLPAVNCQRAVLSMPPMRTSTVSILRQRFVRRLQAATSTG